LIAHFGQWNIGNNIQPLPIQEVKIVAIAIHPSYYNDGLFHDIAVLVLEKPITYSANVLPICLPKQGEVFLAGTRCYGLGWGSDSFGELELSLQIFSYYFFCLSAFILSIHSQSRFRIRRAISDRASKGESSYH